MVTNLKKNYVPPGYEAQDPCNYQSTGKFIAAEQISSGSPKKLRVMKDISQTVLLHAEDSVPADQTTGAHLGRLDEVLGRKQPSDKYMFML